MKKIKILALIPLLLLAPACKKTAFYAMKDTKLIISSDKASLKTNGDKAKITVVGITSEGEAIHDHTLAMFTATLGTIPATAEFLDGRTTVDYVAGSKNGIAEIMVRSGNNVSEILKITVGSGALAILTISALPLELGPRGGHAQINVYAFDAAMNPLADIPVMLSTTAGELDHGNNVRLTDSSGLVSESLYTEATAKVTAMSGNQSKEVTITVRENALPTANFTISPDSVKIGETVYFNGSLSSDPDGRIVSWEWNFGDGTTAKGSTTSHSYATAATYSVSLKVIDDAGDSAVFIKPIIITE
jgi:hypothetical protein